MMYQQEIERVAEMISKEYGVAVPKYDLTGVFEVLTAFDPTQIKDAITECLLMAYKHIPSDKRYATSANQDLFAILQALRNAFSNISFNREQFNLDLEKQVENNEGLFVKEDLFDYPSK